MWSEANITLTRDVKTLSIVTQNMSPYSQWCRPGPERRGVPSGETPRPSAHAPIGCWDPHWSRRYSESVWLGLRTCGREGGITGHADVHDPSPSSTTHMHTVLQPAEEYRLTGISVLQSRVQQLCGRNKMQQIVSVCSLPECAEGLIVVDVSRTQRSHHRRARIPPWHQKKRK